MSFFSTWNILGIIAVIVMIFFSKSRNAVWGGLTLGAIIGLVIAIVYFFKEGSFQWAILKKAAIIGTFLGLLIELSGKLSTSKRGVQRTKI